MRIPDVRFEPKVPNAASVVNVCSTVALTGSVRKHLPRQIEHLSRPCSLHRLIQRVRGMNASAAIGCNSNTETQGGTRPVSRTLVDNARARLMFEFFRKLTAMFRSPAYDPKNPPLGMEAMDLDLVNKTNAENERIEKINWRHTRRR